MDKRIIDKWCGPGGIRCRCCAPKRAKDRRKLVRAARRFSRKLALRDQKDSWKEKR